MKIYSIIFVMVNSDNGMVDDGFVECSYASKKEALRQVKIIAHSYLSSVHTDGIEAGIEDIENGYRIECSDEDYGDKWVVEYRVSENEFI